MSKKNYQKVKIEVRDKQFFLLEESDEAVNRLCEMISRQLGYEVEREKKKKFPHTTVLRTNGLLSRHEDGYELSFAENFEGVISETTFFLGDNGIVTRLSSDGLYPQMVFSRNTRNFCAFGGEYDEPNSVCVATKKLENTITDKGGRLYIDYNVEVGGAKVEHSEYKITVNAERI